MYNIPNTISKTKNTNLNQTKQRSMVNKLVSRRVKSKVELQLEREKKDEEMRIKKQKHMAWLQHQSRRKASAAATASAKVHIAAPKMTRITASPATIKKTSQHVVLEVYVPCKALNNSWADQTEFEDFMKCMLMRMAIKKLKTL